MLITEQQTIDGAAFTHCYSDAGKYIERGGILYIDTLDPVEAGRSYTETDVDIEEDTTPSEAADEPREENNQYHVS